MAACDLVGLPECKAWLGVSSPVDDDVLSALITAISAAVLADLGRPPVLPATYTEKIDAGGGLLRQWPVIAVLSCTGANGAAVAPVRFEPADSFPPGAPQRLWLRRHVGGDVLVTYRAGYAVLGEPAILPAAAPFTVAAAVPHGAWRCDLGVLGASAGYTVAGGVYTFAAADAGATVQLSYGYVPADLARATLEWVADRYAARGRIGQSAKTLGGQETTSFVVKALPDHVARLLQPYRRVAR